MPTPEDFPSEEEPQEQPSPESETEMEMSESSEPLPARTEWQRKQDERKVLLRPNYSPVEVLLAKLEVFLMQQPEWAVLLAAPRNVRREAVRQLAKKLLTIPPRRSIF